MHSCILEKASIQEVFSNNNVRCVKYLIRWKNFIIKYNIWGKKVNLKNVKEIVSEFEKRLSVKVEK